MIRLLLRLLNIKDYEVCQSCETLKQQLAYERDEKRQLTETLLSIVKPKTFEAPPTELTPIITTSGMFSRRRAAAESKDREEAKILREAKYLGKPDDGLKAIEMKRKENENIAKLEEELGIEEKEA